jgi:hypothetical protein
LVFGTLTSQEYRRADIFTARKKDYMNFEELRTSIPEWLELYKQYRSGCPMSKSDIMELVRLNHIIILAAHDVHNESMSPSPFERNRQE